MLELIASFAPSTSVYPPRPYFSRTARSLTSPIRKMRTASPCSKRSQEPRCTRKGGQRVQRLWTRLVRYTLFSPKFLKRKVLTSFLPHSSLSLPRPLLLSVQTGTSPLPSFSFPLSSISNPTAQPDSKRLKITDLLQFINDRLSELEEEKEELKQFQVQDRQRRSLEYSIYQRELRDVGEVLDGVSSERRFGGRRGSAGSAGRSCDGWLRWRWRKWTIDEVEALTQPLPSFPPLSLTIDRGRTPKGRRQRQLAPHRVQRARKGDVCKCCSIRQSLSHLFP